MIKGALSEEQQKVNDQIIENLKTVFDPEISINIYDLGLIYDIDLTTLPKVVVTHTLTSVFCPAADQIIDDIKIASEKVNGIDECMIVTTFEPPFGPEMMSEEARLILNI
jgi:metal-sulfur cluster biosynthetic enzyme